MSSPESERFKLVRRICERFCFTLYEVEDLVDRKKRFLKILNEEMAKDGVCVFNFLNAARMSSLVEHDRICNVYYYGTEGRNFVVVSEAVDLKTLSLFIHESYPLPLDDVVDLVKNIADILRSAHLHGLVHGLLNPNCIYVNEDGYQVKIDDFGYSWLASQLGKLEEAEAMYLSYHIAPEILKGEGKFDGRADIYSLGVVLLQLLTDYIPFNYFDNISMQNRQINLSLRTLRKVLPHYPDTLDDVILKTLHRNPESRFQNMKDLTKSLDRLKREYRNQVKKAQASRSVHSNT